MRIIAAAVSLSLAAAMPPAPATAGAPGMALPRDLQCSVIRKLPDGKFTYTMEPGLSVAEMVRKPGPFVNDRGDDVVAYVCIRTDPIPEIDDVEVLLAGFEFFVAGEKTGMRMIKLKLVDGRVTHEVSSGALDAGERKKLTRVLEAMQRRVDAAGR